MIKCAIAENAVLDVYASHVCANGMQVSCMRGAAYRFWQSFFLATPQRACSTFGIGSVFVYCSDYDNCSALLFSSIADLCVQSGQ